MRILHFMPKLRYDVGGPVRAVIDLSGALTRAGHQVTVLTWDDEAWPKDWARQGPSPKLWKVDPPGWPGGLFSGAQMKDIRSGMREYDILHMHGVWEASDPQLAESARQLGLATVVSLRGMLDDWPMSQRRLKKRLYLRFMGREMLERASFVHCTAQGEYDQSVKWFPRGRGVVIPNLIDLSPYTPLPGPGLARENFPALSNGRPTVLFLSRVNYKKGADVLIDAARLMRDRGVNANILIAGPADADYLSLLTKMVAESQLGDRVQFLGQVTGRLKDSLYEASDVFALPTSQENFGFVFYEALACATPVVTTFAVDTWPELKESGGAIIVDRTAEAFAEAIPRVIGEKSISRAMGEAGRAWVLKNLATERVLAMFIDAYAGALQHGGARSSR